MSKLTYRRGVIGIVIDPENNFLITQLADYTDSDWRFPGGGIEDNETPELALMRELYEEMGTNAFKIIKKSIHQIKYDWPMNVIEKRLIKKGKTYKGQIQDQILVEFIGKRGDIKIDPTEIKAIKWVKYDELKNNFNFPNQWDEAQVSLKELLPKIAK